MAVQKAYVEANARVVIPATLRPAPGATLVVVLEPRPPLTPEALALANPAGVASIQWIDADGGGHLEPLWLSSAPPASEGYAEVDRYGGTFARARLTFAVTPGTLHALRFRLATVAGPGGEVLADTDELEAMGGVVWYDETGSLGHVKAIGGTDATVAEVAAMIDAGTLVGATSDHSGAHPDLLLSTPAPARRRAVLGDLVPALSDYAISLTEASANEIDVVGAEPLPPAGGTLVVTVEALRAALKAPPGPAADLALGSACAAATTILTRYTGNTWADPVPANVALAGLQVASRVYRSADVVFGVLNTDLGTSFTGRWVTPEIEALLIGERRTFGVA